MKITGLEQLTHERWVNLFAAAWEHNGHTGRWVFASRRTRPHTGDGADAVLIVPILRNPGEPPRLVLIREFRVPVGHHVIGLPAGLIEEGEPVEEAIRREVREETGFEVTAIHRISPALYSSSGLTDESAPLAFSDVSGHPGSRQDLGASEDIEVMLLDHAAICRLCDTPTLRIDARAWMILHHYQQLGALP
jgi:ADP-ribose pyrophosphatase